MVVYATWDFRETLLDKLRVWEAGLLQAVAVLMVGLGQRRVPRRGLLRWENDPSLSKCRCGML